MFPKNEAETIELYKTLQDELGWRIVHLQTPFPDAVIENGRGQQLVVEFEYEARNFKLHGHDPKGCDLVICWRNNWPDAPLPVWALDKESSQLADVYRFKVAYDALAADFERRLLEAKERHAASSTRLMDAVHALPRFFGPVVFNRVGTFYTLEKIDMFRLVAFSATVKSSPEIQAVLDKHPTFWEKE